MNTKNLVISAVVLGAIFLGGSYIGKSVVNITTPDGTRVEQVVGATAGTDHYNTETFWAGFGGKTLATSTSGTATTLGGGQGDVLDSYTSIYITPNTASFTYTLPATSTLAYMKNPGDKRSWTFVNATTTTATNLTVAKGAGWNLTGVDANVDVIAGAAWGSQVNMSLECERQPDTDVLCKVTERIATD